MFGLNYFWIFHVSFEKLYGLKTLATVLKIVIEIVNDMINYANLLIKKRNRLIKKMERQFIAGLSLENLSCAHS